ncbi:MAG TPA: ATP-dependent DNA ligase, partial [Arachnia sp.]|nr:ATP-dependent DNA ligase [Arachnia sp.]
MLAKPVKRLPAGEYLFEPKWDGFRSIVWRSGDQVEIGSRNSRPMTRYFPELVEAIVANFPDHSVIDGEIVMIDPGTGDRLNFDLLQQRIHPAASRIAKLSTETPASFVAFDLLALGQENYVEKPFRERREALERVLADAAPPIFLTQATRDEALAMEWFAQFEGAGLDG